MNEASSKKAVYFDCYSGISGDMILGALLDCGVDLGALTASLTSLPLKGWRLKKEKVKMHGLVAAGVTVVTEEVSRPRHLPEILQMITGSALPEPVKNKSVKVFQALARAEAAVHDMPAEKVHFHEVGAVDAIIDIVGSVTALYLLEADLVYCSPLPMGNGMTGTAHGLIPLPAPATLELIKQRQVPVYGKDVGMELVTPTGAAIVTTLAESFGSLPPMVIMSAGCGAGKKDPGYPNFLRVFYGPIRDGAASGEETVQVIEANIDDMNPELYGYLMEKLLNEGAMDVYFTPIQMKKNRPAVKLSVLSSPACFERLVRIIFLETTTLGLRVLQGRKVYRPRQVEKIETPWGSVRVKVIPSPGGKGGPPLHVAPEYEDCLKLARCTDTPLKEIYRQVEYLFWQQHNKIDP